MGYSEEEKIKIFDDVIKLISGGLSLRKAIVELNIINKDTFFSWIAKDTLLADQYTRACEVRADSLFEEMLDIADDGTNDYITKRASDGTEFEVVNTEHIQRSKLRIETRKWNLSKMNPKKYGDKIDVTTNNESLNVGVAQLSTEELIARSQAINKINGKT
jgi:hypothetical protein